MRNDRRRHRRIRLPRGLEQEIGLRSSRDRALAVLDWRNMRLPDVHAELIEEVLGSILVLRQRDSEEVPVHGGLHERKD